MFPSPANPTLLRRVAGTIRAFALLEDPELESRITREAALVRAHHRRTSAARLQARHRRHPGAIRAAEQPCRTPLARRVERV
jgi:hypothetical protein